MPTSGTVCPEIDQYLPLDADLLEAETGSNTQAPAASIVFRRYTPYLIFTLCATLYLLPFMLISFLGGDEGTLLSGAVRIRHGQVFARDFFEVMGPGTFYWLAAFFKLFGVTFAATRVCLFFTSLGTGLLMYFLARRVCPRYKILPCILVVSTFFGTIWPSISHHIDSNFFALLSVACVILWQKERWRSLLLASGALAGATTCVLQQKGLLLLVSIFVWLYIQHRRRSVSLSSLGLVVAGYCSVVGIATAYFWNRHALWDLVYANIVWPSRHYSAINVVPYAQGLIRDHWDQWVMPQANFHWTILMAVILITPFLFVSALPALLPVLAFLHRKNTLKPEILLYWFSGCAMWLSEFHRKDICHLVCGSPLLIILCIYYLGEDRTKVSGLALQSLAISATCLATLNLFLVLVAHPLNTRVGRIAVFKGDPVIAFLDKHVNPGDDIFAYPYCPIYYFLTATANPTPYSILLYDYNTRAQFQEVTRILDQRRVRYVLWDAGFRTNVANVFFPKSQSMPSGGYILEPYLDSHYKLVKTENGIRIMERKSEDYGH